jgi:hypothetical protein
VARPIGPLCHFVVAVKREKARQGEDCAESFGSLKAQCFAGDSFKFKKLRQFFVRSHNKPPPVVAMRVSNENRSPFTIHGCDTAPTPSGFAELVCDNGSREGKTKVGCLIRQQKLADRLRTT